jgi:hypothetical protein
VREHGCLLGTRMTKRPGTYLSTQTLRHAPLIRVDTFPIHATSAAINVPVESHDSIPTEDEAESVPVPVWCLSCPWQRRMTLRLHLTRYGASCPPPSSLKTFGQSWQLNWHPWSFLPAQSQCARRMT